MSKQPYCFEVNNGELFAFGGLWDGWKDSSGQWIKTSSILTTTPNVVTSAIHDRMPVILDREGYDLWLDPGLTNVQVVSELLKPYDARLMRCDPVSSVCPACLHQWTETQCLSCSRWSPHSDWYSE